MKAFMADDFLLTNDTAVEIFSAIRGLPIIDYHCHLDPAAIANNARFSNITELWLAHDHYKWRLMRAHGMAESHITGDAPDHEKFAAWARTLEIAIGNPLYHWSHMELREYFGWDKPLTAENAAQAYLHCNAQIQQDDFCVHALLKRARVAWLATTDDPADTLAHHAKLKADAPPGLAQVLPTFRPGVLLDPAHPAFADYIKKLGTAAGMMIADWDDLLAALDNRLYFFAAQGCILSDHSLEPPVFDPLATEGDAAAIFARAIKNETLTPAEITTYQTRLLSWLGGEYKKRGWVMQLHMGAQRANNTRMLRLVGADAGFDSIGDAPFSQPLARILNDLEARDALPRTILYGLNPAADDMLATMAGNYQGRGIPGRIQWGAAWWFNDTKQGITKHLQTLAAQGMLAHFVGMLTDSRSFISYPRHEYFRRILANQLGTWVESGEFPHDQALLVKLASNIAYYNAKGFFV